ncbi:MAG: (4Fe-4S)-binding protein [Clostridia bacterium]|nr:(4Fe-4S)-binding protein [Clostridia bacterium]
MLKPDQIASVKGRGFLLNRGTENFSGRIVACGAVFSAEDLRTISEVAEKFGSGTVAFTSRLSAEVVGIPFEKIDEACAYAAERGLYFGGTGAKIRPITACKGTTCVYGNYDTQALAKELHENYYIGWSKVQLPHKFKIGVGGCPNSCMKPSLNDFGVEGRKAPIFNADLCRGCKVCAVEKACPSKAAHVENGKLVIGDNCLQCGVCTGKCPFKAISHESETVYRIYVGGTWGKTTRMGTPLTRLVSREEIAPLLEKTMLWFKENAYQKERLGKAIDRLGLEKFEADVFSDDLLNRKDEILAAPMKTL